MMCMLQIGLLVLGIALLRKRQIRVGDQVAPAPTPFFMGLVLILQLPLVLMVGFGLGVSEGVEIAKKSQGKQVSQSEMTAQVNKFQQKYWWIDIAIPAGAAAIAGVLLALGLKDRPPEPQDPYADPYAGADAPRRKSDPNDMLNILDDDEPTPRRKRGQDEF